MLNEIMIQYTCPKCGSVGGNPKNITPFCHKCDYKIRMRPSNNGMIFEGECHINTWSSRVCEKGTRCCIINHHIFNRKPMKGTIIMNQFDVTRKVLLDEVKSSKDVIISEIECGTKDWSKIETYYKKYKNCLMAADKLCCQEVKE